MKKIIFIILVFIGGNISAQQFHFVEKYYKNFSDSNYFEKIYIHSDKDIYYTGENIWFKNYLIDAKTNLLDTNEQIFTVELIAPTKKIIFIKKYLMKKGVSWGDIFLPDSINSGFYQLRAFTNSMKNFPSEFFFTKTIYINSPNKKFSKEYFISAKKAIRKKKEVLIDYKFEGKNFIAEHKCKLVYEIKNIQDNKFSGSVYITDKKGNIVSNEKNSCINYLTFTPQKNEKYFLVIKSNKNRKTKIKLNAPIEHGISMQKNIFDKKIVLKFFSNNPKTNDSLAKTYILIGENNGRISFLKYFKIDSVKELSILKENIPEGISNYFLINVKNKIIASLPIYFTNKDKNKLNFSTTQKNDTLFVFFKSKEKINGNFSISINSHINKNINIKQYFTLISEMPFISNYYKTIELNDSIIDLLTILYYKERYSMNDILANNLQETKYKPLKSLSVSGKVKYLKEQITAKNAKLNLIILNSFNDIFDLVADENGVFSFNNLNYLSDSIKFTLNALTKNNLKKTIILLDQYDTSKIHFNRFISAQSILLKRKNIQKNTNKNKRESISRYNFHPGQIISGKELEESGYNNILESLRNKINGYKTNLGDNSATEIEPLYLLNDNIVDAATISDINPADIEQVEIMSNPSEGMVPGSFGINGIIAVFTKGGNSMKWGVINSYITGISIANNFIPSKKIEKYYTYNWIPNVEITNNTFTLKIPLKKQTETYINIQGFSNNYPVFYTKKIN